MATWTGWRHSEGTRVHCDHSKGDTDMHFSSGINRPPYETADGYLQTTQGCSHNSCLSCTYFKDQKFRKSTIEEIEEDIKEMPKYFGAPKMIFLQGAD